MATRLLQAEPLQVAPDLAGHELASPVRRASAFAVDYLILLIPTMVVVLLWVTAVLWAQDRPALKALVSLVRLGQEDTEGRLAALRDLTPLLVRIESDRLPWEFHEAVAAGDLDRAAETLVDRTSLVITMSPESGSGPLSTVISEEDALRLPLERLIPRPLRWLSLYGVALVYFAIFARSRRGATLGKRMLRIRVVGLDGGRLSLWNGIERFVAYLSIPGTLGFGLIDLWRDPNRRMAHDRVANTAVVRVPAASRARQGPRRPPRK